MRNAECVIVVADNLTVGVLLLAIAVGSISLALRRRKPTEPVA